MKNITLLFFLILVSISCVGCDNEKSNNEVENLSVANPFKTVESSEAFKSFGISIEVPVNSTNIEYYTIDNKTAQIDFDLNNHRYTYRATKNPVAKMHGIYDNVINTEQFFIEDVIEVNIDTTDTNITIVTWSNDDVYYSLTTDAVIDNEIVLEMVQELTKN